MNSQREDCQIPIREVTVLEDRALIRRSGKLTVEAGRNRLTIVGVAPVLLDKSVQGDVTNGTARITDVRAVRERALVDDLKPEDLRILDEEIRLAQRHVDALGEDHTLLEQEIGTHRSLRAAVLHELQTDAAWGREINAERQSGFDTVSDKQRALHQRQAVATLELKRAQQSLGRLVARRAAADRPSSRRLARLDLDIEASESGEVEVELSYVVANACWRPRHRAVLNETDALVSVQTEAIVWQNTGEDWTGASLSLSTERPTLGTEPPALDVDWLATVRKGALVVETRSEEIEQAGLGAAERKRSADLPGIDDGGEAQHIRAPHPVDIPSDGRPHAVPIAAFSTKAEVEIVAAPELVLAAITKTSFAHAGTRPLLAGPVELVKGGGNVGRTTIGFIAPKEKLALGWGPDNAIRVHREVEALKDESSMLSSWVTKTHDVRVRLSNLGPYAKTIVVKERVPVSEIDKVQIATVPKETTGEKEPDAHGIVTWRVELPPFGRQQIKLRVVTRRHSDVAG